MDANTVPLQQSSDRLRRTQGHQAFIFRLSTETCEAPGLLTRERRGYMEADQGRIGTNGTRISGWFISMVDIDDLLFLYLRQNYAGSVYSLNPLKDVEVSDASGHRAGIPIAHEDPLEVSAEDISSPRPLARRARELSVYGTLESTHVTT